VNLGKCPAQLKITKCKIENSPNMVSTRVLGQTVSIPTGTAPIPLEKRFGATGISSTRLGNAVDCDCDSGDYDASDESRGEATRLFFYDVAMMARSAGGISSKNWE
jgi:hypothetical protein